METTGLPSNWSLNDQKLEIGINNNFTKISCKFNSNPILGNAINKNGEEWNIEIKQNNESYYWHYKLLNTSWELIDAKPNVFDLKIEYFKITFLENQYKEIDNDSYWFINGDYFFSYSEDKQVYNTCILVEGLLICKTKSLDGIEFQTIFRKIETEEKSLKKNY